MSSNTCSCKSNFDVRCLCVPTIDETFPNCPERRRYTAYVLSQDPKYEDIHHTELKAIVIEDAKAEPYNLTDDDAKGVAVDMYNDITEEWNDCEMCRTVIVPDDEVYWTDYEENEWCYCNECYDRMEDRMTNNPMCSSCLEPLGRPAVVGARNWCAECDGR